MRISGEDQRAAADLAQRRLLLEIQKLELELDKMAIDMEKLRLDVRNDTRRVYWQMWGAIAATVAATGAVITATIALTKVFL